MLTLDAITIDSFAMVRMLEDEMAKTDDDRETSLSIKNLKLDESMASKLLRFFQNCSEHGLEMDKLVIYESSINLCLVHVLYAVMSMDLFKELSLTFQDHGENLSLLFLLQAQLRPIKTPINWLQTFDIDFDTFDIDFANQNPSRAWVLRDIVTDIVTRAENLENLCFMGWHGLSEWILEELVGSCRNLKTFSVESVNFYVEDAVLSQVMKKVLEQNPGLQTLNLCNFCCGNGTLFRIASHCPKLEVLDLGRTGLERLDFGTSFAQPSPCCGLRVLDLDWNPFDEQVKSGLGEEHEKMIIAVLQAISTDTI
jgi:hypothetical protein